MAILYAEEIHDMMSAGRTAKLEDLETELLNVKAMQAANDVPESPGCVSELKKTITRIKMTQDEEGDLDEE